MSAARVPRPAVLDEIPLDRDAVIEASAGTGKTFTLQHLVVDRLLRSGVSIEEILVVTFTEKATLEMRQRVRDTIANLLHADSKGGSGNGNRTPAENAGGSPVWVVDDVARRRLREALTRFDRAPISTIHGFCQRVLTQHAFDSRGLFREEQVEAGLAFSRALRAEVRRVLAETGELREACEQALASWPLETIEARLFPWFAEPAAPMPRRPDEEQDTDRHAFAMLVHGLLPRVREALDGFKRARGMMDFDDMLVRVRDALRGDEGATLLRELRTRYRYALVDEFQDTDEVQWEIFRRIFFESPEHTLYVIGDPKQAIYRFRGADVDTYLRARRTLVDAGGASVALRANYRSTASVIEGYDRILTQGYFRCGLEYEGVRCARPDLGLVTAGMEGEPAADSGYDTEAPAVCLLHVVGDGESQLRADDVRSALHDAIAREIRTIVEERPLYQRDERGTRRLGYGDIHVLARTANDLAQVGEALRRRQVPRAFFKQEGLFATPEARHILDVLRAVEDPSDRSRRLRAWLTPLFAVPLEDLPSCRDVDDGHPLLARLHAWKARAERHEYGMLVRSLLEDSGLVRRELFFGDGERELTNYYHILEILLEETHANRRGLPELISRLEAYIEGRALAPNDARNIQRLESEKNAVQLLTMHKAKGLEAPVVFVVGGLNDPPPKWYEPSVYHDEEGTRRAWIGQPPADIKERVDREGRGEDERLFYVALTRASARLYLPYLGAPQGAADDDRRYAYRVSGGYRVVHDRLRQIVREGEAPHWLGYRRAPVPQARAAGGGPREPAPLWEPPAALVEPARDDTSWYETLRRRHGGVAMTSFTQLEAERELAGGPPPFDDDEPGAEPETDTERIEAEDDGVPGGTSAGVFLHEVLETLPFEGVVQAATEEAWAREANVEPLFRTAARRNNIPDRAVEPAKQMVFRALRMPLRVGDLALDGGLAEVTRRRAEMGFHFPLPEEGHPDLGAPRPDPEGWPFEVGRGFVRGVVDLVFEHEGKFYFLDWKSNRLPDWSAQAVRAFVHEHYRLQAVLYALAVIRMLDVRDRRQYETRFGGLVYAFLRGMARDEAGAVCFELPDWDTVRAWEATLREPPDRWRFPIAGGSP